MKILQTIYENKLVAVIRGANKDNIIPVAEALREGGVNILEITAETPGVMSLIEELRSTFSSEEVTVGAGTVLDSETARMAISSGAQFIFSPTTNVDTIQMTKRYGVASIPGAMTPTEILTAYEHGADIIKVFPAGNLGPKYFKDIAGPLSHIPLMPTGGVNLDNVREYFENGAVAAGLGSALVNTKQVINDNVLHDITEKATQFNAKVK